MWKSADSTNVQQSLTPSTSSCRSLSPVSKYVNGKLCGRKNVTDKNAPGTVVNVKCNLVIKRSVFKVNLKIQGLWVKFGFQKNNRGTLEESINLLNII